MKRELNLDKSFALSVYIVELYRQKIKIHKRENVIDQSPYLSLKFLYNFLLLEFV